ncbi:hypothetical protein RchiOBHm_Chr3g0475901 [Rosa chinensis]|uniref:Uncharacterized protein n=1 Tax=Rosa chinensis TaxID=74649 RepID=A0A2P6RCI9_ROSCH|nr:hypothetical protein RchiOBHm_Chr3g0475901 [Rosa chinensis]
MGTFYYMLHHGQSSIKEQVMGKKLTICGLDPLNVFYTFLLPLQQPLVQLFHLKEEECGEVFGWKKSEEIEM